MYYYIYDADLADKKYHKQLVRIEKRLTDLGVNGKVHHLSFLKNISQIIDEEIKRGISALVIVGDDSTVGQLINLLPDNQIPIGIIPINTGGSNIIAQSMGINNADIACDILSARIIEDINIGIINQYKFITSLLITNQSCTIECDHNYSISIDNHHSVEINNLRSNQDDYIQIIIRHHTRNWLAIRHQSSNSIIRARKVNITSQQSVTINIKDENKIIKTPATISILKNHLSFIVGKNRTVK